MCEIFTLIGSEENCSPTVIVVPSEPFEGRTIDEMSKVVYFQQSHIANEEDWKKKRHTAPVSQSRIMRTRRNCSLIGPTEPDRPTILDCPSPTRPLTLNIEYPSLLADLPQPTNRALACTNRYSTMDNYYPAFFMNLPMPDYGTDAPYEPWYTPEGYALVENQQQQPLLMAEQETEYQELQPMLQPLQHWHLQQLDMEQQFPSASPAYFHETDVYTPPASSDFLANPYAMNTSEPVEMEMKPVITKTRGRKRKVAEVLSDEEDELENCVNIDQPASASTEKGKVFCNIVGRLCVIGSLIHYDVTTDEIKRRASKPEGMIRSHIGPLLKRGKVSGTGTELQKLLEGEEILLSDKPIINRKQCALNTLSALLEGESVQLSADHRELALAHFPLKALARLIIRSISSPAELVTAATEAAAANAAISSFTAVLNQWTSGGWTKGREAILASPLRTFAYATHVLGVEECLLMATLFTKFLHVFEKELVTLIEHVEAKGCGSAAYLHQFPPGIEAPISGRLTLQNRKYSVSVAEINRRVRQPESFNLSILGSLLKRGKTKANCKLLADQLKVHHITLDAGRRKSAKNTTFTAMLEGEALALARDMEAEVGRSFPKKHLIASIVNGTTRHGIDERQHGFASASRIAKSLQQTVLSLQLPVADRVVHKANENAHVIFNYCNLTHGYGPDSTASWMGIFSGIFEKIAKELSRA
ncbi:hypothetical protein PRIPAC_84542 [Pristionchus pacificus]|uniref:Uncharacterized protein n=1 Tax=Pristionchus pacificus TaxID=54126 RepID=A0A2A6BV59_PRIPA|nr:hypothetical protein PRIPAC_84542 [Pristionchus pacificus]|eukprot:PDM69747.1 hypothetical protein PRIPAC_44843 [Pristionchus pacificus]